MFVDSPRSRRFEPLPNLHSRLAGARSTLRDTQARWRSRVNSHDMFGESEGACHGEIKATILRPRGDGRRGVARGRMWPEGRYAAGQTAAGLPTRSGPESRAVRATKLDA